MERTLFALPEYFSRSVLEIDAKENCIFEWSRLQVVILMCLLLVLLMLYDQPWVNLWQKTKKDKYVRQEFADFDCRFHLSFHYWHQFFMTLDKYCCVYKHLNKKTFFLICFNHLNLVGIDLSPVYYYWRKYISNHLIS